MQVCLLTVARRGSHGPTRKLIFLCTQSLILSSKAEKRRSFFMHFYVHKCKLQLGPMPVLTVFQTIFRSRYNIENYASFMLRKQFDFKMQWLSCKTLVKKNECSKYLNLNMICFLLNSRKICKLPPPPVSLIFLLAFSTLVCPYSLSLSSLNIHMVFIIIFYCYTLCTI